MTAPTSVFASLNRAIAAIVPCTRGRYPGAFACTSHPDCQARHRERIARMRREVEARGEPVRPKSRRRRCGCAS